MLVLQTLGRLAFANGGPTDGAAAQPSRLLLLAVLAVADKRGISRERLQALLWPDGDAEHARRALNQALFALRRDLGAQDLVLGATELRLNTEVITCDVNAFESAVAAKEYERAVEAYGGSFLDGVTLRPNAEVENWIDRERLRLEHAYQHSLRQAARAARSAGNVDGAVRFWKRLSASDPLAAATAVELMHALTDAGERAGAVAHARTYQLAVRQELGQEAAPEVIALAKAVANGAASAESRPNPEARLESVDATVSTVPFTAPIASRRHVTGRTWFLVLSITALSLLVATFARTRDTRPPTPTSIDEDLVAIISSAPAENNGPTEGLTRVLAGTIARRLTSATNAKIVTISLVHGTNGSFPTGQANARLVVRISALAPTGPLEVTVSSAATGEQLWIGQMDIKAARDADLTGADSLAERTAAAVAARLDGNLANWIASSSQPMSLDSYREFAQGLVLYADSRPKDAAPHFIAAARDTGFTMALVLAASANYYAGQPRVVDSIVKSLQSRRLPMLDRALVDRLAAVLSHDLGAEHEASLAVSAAAPGSEWRYLQAESALKLGRSSEAVRVLDEVGPDLGWLRGFSGYWLLLDQGLHHLGKYDRELSSMTVARARFPTNRIILQDQLKALAALGETRRGRFHHRLCADTPPEGNMGRSASNVSDDRPNSGHMDRRMRRNSWHYAPSPGCECSLPRNRRNGRHSFQRFSISQVRVPMRGDSCAAFRSHVLMATTILRFLR